MGASGLTMATLAFADAALGAADIPYRERSVPATLTRPSGRLFRLKSAIWPFGTIEMEIQGDAPSSWMEPTVRAVFRLHALGDNWDSNGGTRIQRDAIARTIALLLQIMADDSPSPSVVPLPSGGIQLEWHRRRQDLEIVIEAAGPVQFFYTNRATGEAIEDLLGNPTALAEFVRSLT